MMLLTIATILVTGFVGGIEFAVSAFINPALWKLDDRPMTQELAQRLGRAMPFPYILGLVLLVAEAWLLRHGAHRALLFWAAGLWAATIVYTLLWLVPINNRVARSGLTGAESQKQHRQWDTLHRVRIALLTVAIVCFLLGRL